MEPFFLLVKGNNFGSEELAVKWLALVVKWSKDLHVIIYYV
jgi:hypothetical protein